MTTTHNTTRRVVRTALFSGTFALVVSPFASLAIANAQFDQNWFDWCMNHLEEGTDYCCEHSGGVMRNGACINPDDLRAPSSGVFEQTPTPPKRAPVATVPSGVFEQAATASPTPKPGSVTTVPITTAAVG